jgi:hypothetical protein
MSNRTILGVLAASLDSTHDNLTEIDPDAQLQIEPFVSAQTFAVVFHCFVHSQC